MLALDQYYICYVKCRVINDSQLSWRRCGDVLCDTFVVIGIRVSVKITTGGPGGPGVRAQVGVRRAATRPLGPVAVVHGVRDPGPGARPEHGVRVRCDGPALHSPGQGRGGGGRRAGGRGRGVISQRGAGGAAAGPPLVAQVIRVVVIGSPPPARR